MVVNAIPVPLHPSKEFKGIQVAESEDGIQVTEGINYVVFLREMLLPNDLVAFDLKKTRQAIHIKVHQMTW
jgi:hypothetical protein